ncbi:MAG: hypothetical protein ABS81_31905 [Pseudonocardia sp. SCN 72-86]|nr:MAG: hypothetical protein ABS81_31905 [Pseudonocardia sp. SCN 72-86]
MTDRLHLAALWDGPPCAGEGCSCPRCVAVLDDPSAVAVLAALDATGRDLAALAVPFGDDAGSALPEDVRARILAAADVLRREAGSTGEGSVPPALSTGPSRVGGGHRARRGGARPAGPRGSRGARGPRGALGPGRRSRVALVAVLGVAVVAGIVGWSSGVPATPQAEPTRHAFAGTPGAGPLADPGRQAACLAAVGVPPATALATRDVAVGGAPGVLLVLPTGTIGTYRMLVVDPGCTRVLADRTVGR